MHNIPKVIGYLLLTPPVLSVIFFFMQFTKNLPARETGVLKTFTGSAWTGMLNYGDGGGGYTSALPFYFGLMAIAGAYLIKDQEKRKDHTISKDREVKEINKI